MTNTLRKASALMREQVGAARHTQPNFVIAVADLLDSEAAMCEDFEIDETECVEAFNVARAYLENRP